MGKQMDHNVVRDKSATYQDFDHNDQGIPAEVWFERYAELRRECPVGKSARYGGYWLVTGYPEAAAVIQDTDTFSSRVVTIPPHPQAAPMIPEEIDPPEHRRYRDVVNRVFSAQVAQERHAEPIRAAVTGLIDDFIEAGHCDAFRSVAVPLPAFVLTRLLGLPAGDTRTLCDWVERIVHGSATNPESAFAAAMEQYGYFTERLAERRRAGAGGDDVLSVLLRAEPDGVPLSQEELLGYCLTLLVAGVDTTQKIIGSIIHHLAEDADLRRKLAADSRLLPRAVEEFVRLWTPVQLGRQITRDTEIAGCPMKAGDSLLVLTGATNRDEREFSDATTFRLDRSPNRHFGFGAHVHRCLGAHIARLELRILLEELLRRIPEFGIDREIGSTWLASQVQGMVRVPIRFPPGKRLGPPMPELVGLPRPRAPQA
ncbi:cytochrome P450 [Pseudonocardia eucalypti]|uniref:cytochrome P450 n=1 Tax=Pseudonocardia eucalypti TaxID=648755 RepID=UPI0031EE5E70